MAVPVKDALSSSTNGLGIPIVAVATAGTLIHTSGATGYDLVWLWVSNVTTAVATLTLEWGGVLDPGNHLVNALSIPANSPPIPVAAGVIIRGGLLIRAFSDTASALNLHGHAITVR